MFKKFATTSERFFGAIHFIHCSSGLRQRGGAVKITVKTGRPDRAKTTVPNAKDNSLINTKNVLINMLQCLGFNFPVGKPGFFTIAGLGLT